jgi:hypothetical protein
MEGEDSKAITSTRDKETHGETASQIITEGGDSKDSRITSGEVTSRSQTAGGGRHNRITSGEAYLRKIIGVAIKTMVGISSRASLGVKEEASGERKAA